MRVQVIDRVSAFAVVACLVMGAAKSAECKVENELPTLILQTGHKAAVDRLDMTPDGRTLASSDSNGLIKLWDLPSGQELLTLNSNDEPKKAGHAALQLDPHGKWVASVGFIVKKVAVRSVKPDAKQTILPGGDRVVKLVLSADGTMLVGLREDGALRAWNTQTWKLDPRFSESNHCANSPPIPGMDESYGNQLIAFSRNGSEIVAADMSGGITKWRVSDGCVTDHFTLKGVTPSAIFSLSPDGTMVASSDYRTLRIWMVSAPDKPWSRDFADYGLRQAVFSHDSKQLALGSEEGSICLMDLGEEDLLYSQIERDADVPRLFAG